MTDQVSSQSLNTAFRQYYDLTKPRVVMLIVFTAIVGMLLAVQGLPNLISVVMASLGIGLAASSGAAMNQIIDCLLYTSPSPRDRTRSRMPSSA